MNTKKEFEHERNDKEKKNVVCDYSMSIGNKVSCR